jgi:hypothetical protein
MELKFVVMGVTFAESGPQVTVKVNSLLKYDAPP